MSSPPLNKSCNRAGLFKRPVRSSASPRWPQALVQNRKQLRLRSFVLAAWPSCRGPRQPAANELGGGSVRHVLSPSSNAWPARRRQARPRHIPHPTSLRALHRVPSSVVLRAHLPRPHSVEASGSAFPIKTGSAFPIGIIVGLLLPLEDLGVRKGCRRSMSRTRSAQVRRAERD